MIIYYCIKVINNQSKNRTDKAMATFTVREFKKTNNPKPQKVGAVVDVFDTYEAASAFASANYNKGGYGRLYVSENF